MFLVSDGRKNRKAQVRRLAAQDIAVGVLVAAADFEWTCRRGILAMGNDPTLAIKLELFAGQKFGVKLKSGWEKLVRSKLKGIEKFEEIFDRWAKEKMDKYVRWADIEYAMQNRNKLIHGIVGGIGLAEGRQCVNILECANDILCEYLDSHGKNLSMI